MSELPDLLFYRKNLNDVLRANLEQAVRDVDAIPGSQFTASSDAEITEHVYSKRQVLPIELDEDQEETTMPEETKIDVRNDSHRMVLDRTRPCMIAAMRITVSVPFSGDPQLFRCQPSTFTWNPPRGNIRASAGSDSGVLEIVEERPDDEIKDVAEIKSAIKSTLRDIQNYLGWSKADVAAHNGQLRTHIQACVSNRRSRLGKHAELVTVLGIPLKKKPGAPDLAIHPLRRKLIRPLPPRPTAPTEPGIRDEDYEHILNVIRHEGRTFETTPKTFAKLSEEELRNIILAHLNGHYEGNASGETFRCSGKTDIKIEFESRAAFVGECKVWHGPEQFNKALDQLLGYLTWRDSKAAMIIFNKDVVGFSEIQTSMPGILEAHACFINKTDISQSGEWRVHVRSIHDPNRRILLHVFLFNLYAPKKPGVPKMEP